MGNEDGPVDPNRLTTEHMAKLLSSAARVRIPESGIARDIAEGAPSNPDGTINLVHYAAWLVREMGRGK